MNLININSIKKYINCVNKANNKNQKGLNLVEVMVSIAIITIIILAVINTFYYTNVLNSSFEYNQLIKQKLNASITNNIKELKSNDIPKDPQELLNLLNSKKFQILSTIRQDQELIQKNINIKDIYFSIKNLENTKNISTHDNKKIFLVGLKSTIQYKTPKHNNKYLIITDQINITVNNFQSNPYFPVDPENNLQILNISSPI